ncbi:unnamed protein product [Eruca vesicaria subsp. sativa]|uniref:Uncharacterized protein n=1 Tax=Eruca vesicaria subsp. sativa TaxID=29727 RepID=A0ABC8JLJ0_ERUVS|nr:unnamed protein product [Eruca vesicaria subsp. sativa]
MARKKNKTSTESSKEIKARGNFTRAYKCMKTTTKKFHDSVQSCVNTKDGRAQQIHVLDLHSVQRPSGKMKLQLFPLDVHTRQGLEKDGFHLYLELTLSSRKKVSSVLQHIHTVSGAAHRSLEEIPPCTEMINRDSLLVLNRQQRAALR